MEKGIEPNCRPSFDSIKVNMELQQRIKHVKLYPSNNCSPAISYKPAHELRTDPFSATTISLIKRFEDTGSVLDLPKSWRLSLTEDKKMKYPKRCSIYRKITSLVWLPQHRCLQQMASQNEVCVVSHIKSYSSTHTSCS